MKLPFLLFFVSIWLQPGFCRGPLFSLSGSSSQGFEGTEISPDTQQQGVLPPGQFSSANYVVHVPEGGEGKSVNIRLYRRTAFQKNVSQQGLTVFPLGRPDEGRDYLYDCLLEDVSAGAGYGVIVRSYGEGYEYDIRYCLGKECQTKCIYDCYGRGACPTVILWCECDPGYHGVACSHGSDTSSEEDDPRWWRRYIDEIVYCVLGAALFLGVFAGALFVALGCYYRCCCCGPNRRRRGPGDLPDMVHYRPVVPLEEAGSLGPGDDGTPSPAPSVSPTPFVFSRPRRQLSVQYPSQSPGPDSVSPTGQSPSPSSSMTRVYLRTF